MKRLKGSQTKNTHNTLSIDNGSHTVSIWGKITSIKQKDGKYFVCINGTDAFLHDVDEIILDDVPYIPAEVQNVKE